MFGRKSDRDEEYIAPVEEYRDECDDHEHGQTYSDYDSYDPRNYDYRSECRHDHGQTYEDYDRYAPRNQDYRKDYRDTSYSSDMDYTAGCGDTEHGQTYKNYNSEQEYYDTGSERKEEVARYLQPGEVVLWCEQQRADATMAERKVPGILWIILIVPLMVLMIGLSDMIRAHEIFGAIMITMVKIPFSLPFILIAVSMMKKKKCTYVITDRRVISIYKGRAGSAPLARIPVFNIVTHKSSRNVGWIQFPTISMSVMTGTAMGDSVYSTGRMTFVGITDPDRVAEILKGAVQAQLARQKEKQEKLRAERIAKREAEKAARANNTGV